MPAAAFCSLAEKVLVQKPSLAFSVAMKHSLAAFKDTPSKMASASDVVKLVLLR
jgi:hypothetical protein